MDPNACLDRILRALRDNDHEEAEEAADDLTGWLARGGFAPRSSAGIELAQAMTADGNDPGTLPVCDALYWRLTDEDRDE